jgi:hypothetical protein
MMPMIESMITIKTSVLLGSVDTMKSWRSYSAGRPPRRSGVVALRQRNRDARSGS